MVRKARHILVKAPRGEGAEVPVSPGVCVWHSALCASGPIAGASRHDMTCMNRVNIQFWSLGVEPRAVRPASTSYHPLTLSLYHQLKFRCVG